MISEFKHFDESDLFDQDEFVSQNDFIELTIKPNDQEHYWRQTFGRIGCDAVLFLAIEPDGTLQVLLTHFDPLEAARHCSILDRVRDSYPEGDRHAFVVTWSKPKEKTAHDYLYGGWFDISNIKTSSRIFASLPSTYHEVDLSHLGLEEALDSDLLKYQLCFERSYEQGKNIVTVRVPETTFKETIMVNDPEREKNLAHAIKKQQQVDDELLRWSRLGERDEY